MNTFYNKATRACTNGFSNSATLWSYRKTVAKYPDDLERVKCHAFVTLLPLGNTTIEL